MKTKFNICILIFSLILPNSIHAFSNCQEDDYTGLRALYLSTNGGNWDDNTGWPTASTLIANPTMPTGTDVSTWFGITTDANGCVICIDMDGLSNCNEDLFGSGANGNDLTGTIPPQIGNISNLAHLYLHNNNLYGSLPPEIGNLSNLERVDLNSNQLSGSLPPEIGNLSNLTYWYVAGNQFSGTIPPEIGNLTNLTGLYLSNNQFSGTIPVEITNITSLTHLYLGDNEIGGNIPPEIGNLINLRVLRLPNNQFTGAIPVEIGNLDSLGLLILRGNQFTGTIPVEVGNLDKLISLDVSYNNITGSIPPEIENLSNLNYLDLSDNNITGTFIPEIGSLSSLQYLKIKNNQLSGCYNANLTPLCWQLGGTAFYSNNQSISDGNNFDEPWEDFCYGGAGTCTVDIDHTEQSIFDVYPIPAEDFIVFDVPHASETTQVIFYDVNGRTISKELLTADKKIAVGHLSSGVYMYRLFYKEKVYSGKIMIK